MSELYNMHQYDEYRTMPKLREPPADLPAATVEVLAMKVIGDLTILGMAGGRYGKKLVVAQCKCGKYVVRPGQVIKVSKGQGCTRCRPLLQKA